MKTTTVTREYDAEGRCVRETRVEVEHSDPKPYTVGDDYWWRPQPPWWRSPVITWTASDTTPYTVAPYTIN